MTASTRAQRLIDEFHEGSSWHGGFSVRHGLAWVLRHIADTEAGYADSESFYAIPARTLETLADALEAPPCSIAPWLVTNKPLGSSCMRRALPMPVVTGCHTFNPWRKPMTDTPNRPPLWWAMQGAYFEGRNPGFSDRHGYAAEIRALRDWLVPEESIENAPGRFVNGCCLEDRQRLRALLTTEADRAEGNTMADLSPVA